MISRSIAFVSQGVALALALAIAFAPPLAGCGSGGSEDGDVASAEEASTVVESGAELAAVSAYFVSADATLGELTTAEAAAQATVSLGARLSADMQAPACVSIDTDQATYVEITFDHCTGAAGRLAVNGALRGAIEFETHACGPSQCPTAILYTLTTDGLTVGATSVSGSWQVRDPLAAGPAEWSGSLTVASPRRTVASESAATFTIDGSCVTYSLDATIEGSSGRSRTLAARDVHRCLDSCPDAGSVTITGSAGASLSWSYDGAGAATVTTGGGASFDVTLACGD